MEHYKSYHINLILTGTHYLPMLTITGKNETHLLINTKEDTGIPEAKKEIEAMPMELIVNKKNQLALF